MSIPGSLGPWLNRQFTDENGVPLANGYLWSYATGLAPTEKPIYADSAFDAELANPALFDADGRLTFFLESGGYDFEIYDENDVLVGSIVGVSDPAVTFCSNLGVELAQPVATSVESGYVIVSTDTLVIVDGTGGPDPCVINLSTVADHPLPLTIKNIGDVEVQIRPSGTETIENETAYYYLPVAATPLLPSYFMVNDGVSAWFILASL